METHHLTQLFGVSTMLIFLVWECDNDSLSKGVNILRSCSDFNDAKDVHGSLIDQLYINIKLKFFSKIKEKLSTTTTAAQ